MTLSDKIAAGEHGQEVVEAVAKVMGWALGAQYETGWASTVTQWWREDAQQIGCPNYLTDIRLTLDEIERRGWLCSHYIEVTGECTDTGELFHTTRFYVNGSQGTRDDRNLTLAAITALLRAIGE